MRTEIFHGIETVDPHVWGKVTAGHPYAGCEWFAFGEAVLEQPGTYAVVFDGDEPIGGANFWVLRQEQLPLKGAIERRLMQAFLERRPLIISRTSPCTLQRGVYLPDNPSQAEQVIGEIQRVGLEVAHEHHASFLLADYLYDSDLDLSWGDYTIMRDFLDHGTKRLLVLRPAGCADDKVDAALRQDGRIRPDRRGRRKVDRDVDSVPARRVGAAAVGRRLRIDDTRHLAPVLRRESLDHPSHLAVANQ